MNLAEGILLHREKELRPCVVISSSKEEDPVSHQQDEKSSKCVTSLSYRDAFRALQQHRKWLNDRKKVLMLSLLAAGGTCDHHDPPKRMVVLAYLAHNSVDLFLSVLASTTTTSSNGETTAAAAAAAALLNTRWTVNELAQALQGQEDDDGDDDDDDDDDGSVDYCTLLIYDKDGGLEETARHVAQKLLSTQRQHQRKRHFVECVPLPTFARDRMVPMSELHSTQLDDSLFQPPVELLDYRAVSSDDAVIVFTSGTTGGSKGVRLGHRAIYVQCLAKLQTPCCYNESTRLLANTVPFFHVGGLSSLLAVWLVGGTLVLPSTSSHLQLTFDPRTTLESLRQRLSTTLVVVPAMLYALQQEQEKIHGNKAVVEGDRCRYPAVQLILIGGQSADASTLQFVRHTFPNARIVQTYACTEAASSLTFRDVTKPLASDDASPISGDCVGRPPLHVELRLFRVSDQETAQNESSSDFISEPWTPGLIATRGPHVMNGYWRRNHNSASSKQTPSHTTWLRTNDLGYWGKDGKTLYFCGRATDSIRTGGETVLAAEVERCLLKYPDIVECAVFPLPDRRFGETVACAVVVGDPLLQADGMKEMIRVLCAQQGLAGYKRPRRVFRVDELPRNSSGKILKFKLVDRFGAGQRSRL